MTGNQRGLKRFSTVWAIEDPVDEIFSLIQAIDSYTSRCKQIIRAGLVLALLFFSYVIISVLYLIFTIGETFLFSQSQGTFLLIDSLLELNFPVLSLPFTTIVILFLIQSWKFYDVFENRMLTIRKIWSDKQGSKTSDGNEVHGWNPMEISMLLLEEMEQQIDQVKKQLLISMISLVISAFIISFLTLHLLITDITSFYIFSIGFKGIIPLLFFFSAVLYLPFLSELYRFISWQHQKFEIIRSVYQREPPIIPSSLNNILERVKSYLKNDQVLQNHDSLELKQPFIVRTIAFDLGGQNSEKMVVLRKSPQLVPSKKDIDDFVRDINKTLSQEKKKPAYIRAIFLCDWRDEEGEISDELERKIISTPIILRKGIGRGPDWTYVQILIDYGRMYTMFPLVPEQWKG